MDAAQEMKDKYGKSLEVKILTTDPEEAKARATNVLLNGEFIALDVATDKEKLETFLSENI